MESLQCRNVAVGAVGAVAAEAAAAGEVRGRAVRIKMSQNHGHLSNSSPSPNWRVYASKMGPSGSHGGEDTGLYATVEKSNNFENTKTGSQWLGSNEVYCDEQSSLVTVESVLENEGGKSVEDYKLRAHIFSESAVFFSALKDQNNKRVEK